jgi:hypothetical protein
MRKQQEAFLKTMMGGMPGWLGRLWPRQGRGSPGKRARRLAEIKKQLAELQKKLSKL